MLETAAAPGMNYDDELLDPLAEEMVKVGRLREDDIAWYATDLGALALRVCPPEDA